MKIRAGLLALLLTTSLPAQAPSSSSPVDDAMTALGKGRYLEATDTLAAAAFDTKGKIKDDYAFQMWEQVSVTVSNELDLAVLDRAQPQQQAEASWRQRVSRATSRDAVAEIVSRARDTSIVILNEAHDSPRDRAFALQVARALRPLGYSLLAAETFSNEPAEGGRMTALQQLQRERFARISTGFYSRDPVYGGFIRGALAAGYRPVSYEQTSRQRLPAGADARGEVAAREQAEADNLAAIHLRQPAAKILIYVGYSHVAEAPLDGFGGGKLEWMAARLKRASGIDPLTIDQTELTDLSPTSRPIYQLAAAQVGSRAGILFDGDRPLVLGAYAGAVDLQVVHPRRTYLHGRPSWLAQLGGKPKPVPADLRPAAGRQLVQAFAADAPGDAVPLDQLIVKAGVTPGMLMLPPGPIRFAVQH